MSYNSLPLAHAIKPDRCRFRADLNTLLMIHSLLNSV